MKWIIFFATIWTTTANAVGPSQFYGHDIIEERVRSRLIKNGELFYLGQYLDGREGGAGFPTLSDLLGAYKGLLTETTFRNGAPNSINVLLYYVAFSGFSKRCGHNGIMFNPIFEQTMATMMTWPSSQAQSEAAMQDFWIRVMGYNAPREEFEAWRDFFLQSSYRSKAADETIPAMMTAMMMNPYFLLRR